MIQSPMRDETEEVDQERKTRLRKWEQQLKQALGSTPGAGWILVGSVNAQMENTEIEARFLESQGLHRLMLGARSTDNLAWPLIWRARQELHDYLRNESEE